MSEEATMGTSQEYRVVVARRDTRKVLALHLDGGMRLPRVPVSYRDRPAECLQTAMRDKWALPIFVTDYVDAANSLTYCPCAIAEPLTPIVDSTFVETDVSALAGGELTEAEVQELVSRFESRYNTGNPVGELGWIDLAYEWAQTSIGKKLAAKSAIKQYNVGAGFALVRLTTECGEPYWIKATGSPNKHEYQITNLVASIAPEVVPRLVKSRDDWNAWLMEDAAQPARASGKVSAQADAAWKATEALVRIQSASRTQVSNLLAAGAFDQRFVARADTIDEIFEYLCECMTLQVSDKSPRLDSRTLTRIKQFYLSGCARFDKATVPMTLLHGDLTGGNVVCDEHGAKFVDWCEIYIGYSISSLHHLQMFFQRLGCEQLTLLNMAKCYRNEWKRLGEFAFPDDALSYAPLFAAMSALYGRGTWLRDREQRERTSRRSYARTLARHMARALDGLRQGDALCA